MAITGSSSSVSTPDAGPATLTVVVGTATHDGAAGADAVLRDVRSAVLARDARITWRFVLADGNVRAAESARGAEDARGIVTIPYALQPSDVLNLPYHGQPGRARAIHAILQEARAQQAAACLVVDRRATGCPAGWADAFVQGIVEQDLDYVAPLYNRHPFSGGLVHGIVYPVFRALYGARLHYPMGNHFACSAKFAEAVIPDPVWDSDAGQIGIDLWMSAAALSGGFRVGEAAVEVPASEDRQGLDLGTTIAQVIGVLFIDMERRVRVWQRVRGSRTVPRLGNPAPAPPMPEVDVASFAETFRLGFRELQDVWTEILPPLAYLQWRRLASVPLEAFRVDDALWARTIYDFAMGHRLRVIARDHLLRSLTPMYLAWLASFILEMRPAPADAAEPRFERLCQAFESEKPYLVSQWRWPERFRPVKLRR